jgi:tetratricopeptide (TPR) repeat protein
MGQGAVRLCRDSVPPSKRKSHNLDVTKSTTEFPWWAHLACCLAAVLLLFEVYGPAVRAPFFFDDFSLPFTLQTYRIQPLSEWLAGVRPVLMFTYWINYQQSGLDPRTYHVLNIWLHFFNTALIFLIVRRIGSWVEQDAWKRNILSLFAAGLFLLHPVQTEAVSYITGRSDVLSSLLMLAALLVFVYRSPGRISSSWMLMILMLIGLACGAKEYAVVLPAVLLLTDCFWTSESVWSAIRKNGALYSAIGILGVAGLVYVWRIIAASPSAGFSLKSFTWYQYFFTESRAVWVYLRLFLFPFGQNVDYDFQISKTPLQHGAWLGMLGLIAAIGMSWRYRRRYPLACYGFFLFLLLLAPTSSFVPIADAMVERRLYLPMLGLLLIVFDLLRRLSWGKAELATLLVTILGISSLLSYQRNNVWSNAIALWQDAASKSPSKTRTHSMFGMTLLTAGRCQEAEREYSTAAKLLPVDLEHPTLATADILGNWGLACLCLKQTDPALTKLLQAAAIHPTAQLYSQIGMIYEGAHAWDRSLDFLHRSIQMDGGYEPTYVYLGNLYMEMEQPAEAVNYFSRATALDPADEYARSALGAARYRAAKLATEAAKQPAN